MHFESSWSCWSSIFWQLCLSAFIWYADDLLNTLYILGFLQDNKQFTTAENPQNTILKIRKFCYVFLEVQKVLNHNSENFPRKIPYKTLILYNETGY